tara:strand:- start:3 stop:359 length:357 start_codon:yes stop_codon:yes gene_type:complete
MRILILVLVSIISILIVAIAIFFFTFYQSSNKEVQLSINCKKIVQGYTIEDVSDQIVAKFKAEIMKNYPSLDTYAKLNPNKTLEDYYQPINEKLEKRVQQYLKSQEDRNIAECILENN